MWLHPNPPPCQRNLVRFSTELYIVYTVYTQALQHIVQLFFTYPFLSWNQVWECNYFKLAFPDLHGELLIFPAFPFWHNQGPIILAFPSRRRGLLFAPAFPGRGRGLLIRHWLSDCWAHFRCLSTKFNGKDEIWTDLYRSLVFYTRFSTPTHSR